MKKMELSSQIMSDVVTHMKYSKHLPKKERRENYKEIVTRNKKMHIDKFPTLEEEIEANYKYVYNKEVLPAMRTFQFSGKPIVLNNARSYNCCYAPADHPDIFHEIMFLLLSGCGVGYSVQKHHVDKLPPIILPHETQRFLVGDSIEGWSDAVKVLIKAYFTGRASPLFDFNDIREKGAPLMTSGGKAPGPEPLKDGLHNIQKILDRKHTGEKLTTLEVHDIICFISDTVLAGGIRRSSLIALFSLDDENMLTCKFGEWYVSNPQRGRANNSVVILRHEIEEEVFKDLWKKIELSGSGEPGFFFTNDAEFGLNPCAEISLKAFGVCNLTTFNAGNVETQEELNARVKAATFINTLQASYTDFHYLRPIWKKTAEKEALIGVSPCGIASGNILKLDMKEAANIVKEENARVADLIGINHAARCTTVKPDGTVSLVLGTSSGIHAWHSKYYIRRIRVGKTEPIYTYLSVNHPELVEDEYFKPHIQAIISVPIKAPEGAITRDESALDLLNRVSKVWKEWVKPGHRRGANKNNVSTTVTVKPDEWEIVGQWMWENRDNFTALSVLPADTGSYIQTPFEECTEEKYEELMKTLSKINLDDVVELHDSTKLAENVACAAGACELT